MTISLHEAVKSGDLLAFQRLIRDGADLELTNDIGLTALMWCAMMGEVNCLKLLIKAGANLNASADGYTAIHLIAMSPWDQASEQSLVELISAGAAVDLFLPEQNQTGHWTPLMLACSQGWAWSVRQLIKAGADVCATDAAGVTPLMLAASQSCETIEKIDLLLRAGANSRNKSKDGRTAFDYSESYVESLRFGLELSPHWEDVLVHDNEGEFSGTLRLLNSARNRLNALMRCWSEILRRLST